MRNTQSDGTGELTRLLTGSPGPARMYRPTTFEESRNGEHQGKHARRDIDKLNSALKGRHRGLHVP